MKILVILEYTIQLAIFIYNTKTIKYCYSFLNFLKMILIDKRFKHIGSWMIVDVLAVFIAYKNSILIKSFSSAFLKLPLGFATAVLT